MPNKPDLTQPIMGQLGQCGMYRFISTMRVMSVGGHGGRRPVSGGMT